MNRFCKRCGMEYVPRSPNNVYCSTDCYYYANRLAEREAYAEGKRDYVRMRDPKPNPLFRLLHWRPSIKVPWW